MSGPAFRAGVVLCAGEVLHFLNGGRRVRIKVKAGASMAKRQASYQQEHLVAGVLPDGDPPCGNRSRGSAPVGAGPHG